MEQKSQKKIKICEVCKKEIKIRKLIALSRHKRKSIFNDYKTNLTKSKVMFVSDEGIYFEHKWFCNECWNEIIKSIKFP